MNKEYLTSILSQFYHYIAFSYHKPLSAFDKASLIISIDVDVGSPEVGVKNGGNNDRNVHNFFSEEAVGRIEGQIIPLIMQTFDEFEFPATFALRGQLTDVENSIVNLFLESSTQHEIASHGYSHKVFTALSEIEAEDELRMISFGMNKCGVKPKSFVFPKNQIAHLKLLEKYGYIAFRGKGDFSEDGMYVKRCGNLFDVHPSIFSEFYNSAILKKILNVAVKYRAPFHIWFHPWNLGSSPEAAAKRIAKGLAPLMEHAKQKKKQGVLEFETMCSIAEKFERSVNDQ
jgi:peptidoglycan/xylan/chitin deacetylase (PgdA/CDA1 family)